MKILLDSSVYISALSLSDHFHQVSFRCLEYLQGHRYQMVISRLVLFEVINTLAKHGTSEKNLRMILNNLKQEGAFPVHDIDESYEELFFLFFSRICLKSSDLIIFLTAFEEGALLLTWDKTFLRGAKRMVRCYTPAEFMDLAQRGSM